MNNRTTIAIGAVIVAAAAVVLLKQPTEIEASTATIANPAEYYCYFGMVEGVFVRQIATDGKDIAGTNRVALGFMTPSEAVEFCPTLPATSLTIVSDTAESQSAENGSEESRTLRIQ